MNPAEIGLWGHSMAGNVVFRAWAAQPTIPKVVIWAGAVYSYTDFAEFHINDNSYRPPEQTSERQRRRQELFDQYGEFSPDSWFWQQVAATNYLADIAGEIQVHHATADPVVDIGYSRQLMSLLDATTIPHELFEYNSGGHNLSGAAFSPAMQRTAAFFVDY